jgi:hypothetical protein
MPDSGNSLKEGSPCLWKSFWGLATILRYSWCLTADYFETCIDLRSLNSIFVDCRAIQTYHWLVTAVWIALKDIFQENYMFCEVACFGNVWMEYSFKSCDKVHAVISILTFASDTCCMLEPSTIYPYPSPPKEDFQIPS